MPFLPFPGAGREGGAEATLSCPPAGNETCPERQKNDPTTFYGCNVFDDKAMRRHLPRSVYRSLRKTMDQGERLDPAVADVVASAMKDWAMERGATHYTHVFYPLTGLTAEKHDGFLVPDGMGGLWLNSAATCWPRARPTGPACLRAACVPPSRRGVIPLGT